MHETFWTKTAKDSYLDTLDIIFDRWSLDVALKWDEKVQAILNNLLTHKNLCPLSKKYENLRRCTITEYTSLLYRVKENTIELITFFDTRSDHPF